MKDKIGELVNKYIVQTKQLTENTEAVYELVDSLEALIASEKKALLKRVREEMENTASIVIEKSYDEQVGKVGDKLIWKSELLTKLKEVEKGK